MPLWKGPGGIREQVILRDLCMCQQCKREGRITHVYIHVRRGNEEHQAHVDHKIPHNGDFQKFCDVSGCEALCLECHSRKTLNEERSRH